LINIQDVSCWETGQGRPGCNHKPQTTNLLSAWMPNYCYLQPKKRLTDPHDNMLISMFV